jgi:CIC family chloride channel protein
MGAMLGSAYGAIAHDALPHLAANAGAYGLVGMGAVFASAARAPITAVLIIFELTGDYRVILPLMIAVVIATAVSNAVTSETIYTLKLRRRGIDIDAPTPGLMAQITVGEAHGDPPPPLDPGQPLGAILDRFTAERTNALPVIDADGSFLGVVSASDVEHALATAPAEATARDLVHETPELHADQTLEDAIWRLATTDDDGLPVLDNEHRRLVGWLTHRQLLRAYRARVDHD